LVKKYKTPITDSGELNVRHGDFRYLSELVEKHMSLVRRIVGRVSVSPKLGLDRNELMAAGALGLVSAARRFDPSRGTPFGAFAARRVRGAVLREINNRAKATLFAEGGIDCDEITVPPDGEMGDEDSALVKEIKEFMEYNLTPKERNAVALYYLEEFTFSEVAEALEISELEAVRLVRSAIRRLREGVAGSQFRAAEQNDARPF